MSSSPRDQRSAAHLALAAIVLALALPACAQHVAQLTPAPQYGDDKYRPSVAQPGKDVIWVPTPDDVVARMLQLAQTTPDDLVYDLGAGDGKIAIMAAKRFGARAVGIEFNPDMAALGQRNAEREGVAQRVQIRRGDIFESDFSNASVITLFLLPSLNLKLRPTLLNMRPGTRIVSHAFDMDDWKADETSRIDGRTAYFWLVPARVQGRWTLAHPTRGRDEQLAIDFSQIYQRIEGEASLGKLRTTLRDPILRGSDIAFTLLDDQAVRFDFVGRVAGNVMDGTVRGPNGEGRWRAERR
jgi:SAM-dependent methyltransferase